MHNNTKKTGMPSARRILQNNIYSLKFMWQYSKMYLMLSLVQTLLGGLVAPLQLLLTSILFTALEERRDYQEVFLVVLILTLSTLGYTFWSQTYKKVLVPGFSQTIHLKVQSDFFEKVRRMDLSKYDEPDFYNDFI